jgi:3-hydroxyisobutyrate dehydrogenase
MTNSFVVIGAGEVGSTFAAELRKAGASVTICVRPHSASYASARATGASVVNDIERAVAAADVVLVAVPGAHLVEVGSRAAKALSPHALFVDLTAASPDDISRTKAMLVDGDRFIDVAILGAVSLHGAKVPMIAAGQASKELASILNPMGFRVRVLENAIAGDATTLKLLRSVLTKGLEAVIIECFLAAEATGLRPLLMDNLGDLDETKVSDIINMFLKTHTSAAERRLHEMRAAKRQLDRLGLPQFIVPAILARFQHTVDILKDNSLLIAEGSDAISALVRVAETETARFRLGRVP